MKGTKWMIPLCAALLSCGMTVSAAPFDPAYYAAQNPDVVQAVGEDETALELHYNIFGAAEGRAANAQEAAAQKAKTPVSFEEFDPAYYAEQNPDVTALLGTDPAALYAHYVLFGAAEGRLPKAPEVIDPYARFASSASSSKSSKHSKHSDDDDDDDESSSSESGSSSGSGSSTQSCALYQQTRYEKDNSGSGSYTPGHHWYKCDLEGNCTNPDHYGRENCSLTYQDINDDTDHKRKCSICGRDETAKHNIVTDPPENKTPEVLQHTNRCSLCGHRLASENCTMTRYLYEVSDKVYQCVERCTVCWVMRKYTHQDSDLDEDGKCTFSENNGKSCTYQKQTTTAP